MLLNERDIQTAIAKLLQAIGVFYRAERAYLFTLQDNGQYWDNTCEWCDEGVAPQIDHLQEVPLCVTKRWMEMFRRGECVVIEDLETLRETAPEEWEVLTPQGVKNLLAAPVWRDQQIVGFIGVDNPRAHVRDCGHGQTISCFLADRLVKDATKNRLNELLNLHYEDILKTTNLGLWVIRLTKVFNRGAFEEEVTRHMLNRDSNNTGTLLLIDMDHFKDINDHFGHTVGDTLLRKTSDILMSSFSRKDLIGRFGGGEFLVFLKNVTNRTVISRRIGELQAALADVDGREITCSIGVVEVHREEFSYDRSLRRADMAMYRSKEHGRNTYCYYEDL